MKEIKTPPLNLWLVMYVFYAGLTRNSTEFVSRFPYRVGIVTFMVFPELLKSDEGAADKVRVLAEDPFFDLLEVGLIRDSEWGRLTDFIKGLGRRVDFALGLQPEVLVRGYNPSSLARDERKRAEEILVKAVDVAGSRGMKAVALCSGPVVEEGKVGKAIQAFIKTVSAIAERASKYGMPVYIETFDVVWDKKRLVGKLDVASRVIEGVRRNYGNVYILWDLSHAPLLGEKPEDLKQYSDLIGHIHIGCTKRVNGKLYDWHPGFYRPGAINTERDVAKLIEVLSDIGYRGAVSFEVKPEEGQHPLEVVNAAKAVLLRAYQLYLEGRYFK